MSEKDIINSLVKQIDIYLKENIKKYDIQLGGLAIKKSSKRSSKKGSKKSSKPVRAKKIMRSKKVPASRRILPPISVLRQDSLKKYGYKLSKSPLARRRALKKAARSRGTLQVLKRVNLIGNYSKSVPDNYQKLRSDVEYLKKQYAKEKLKSFKKK
jgi:hypothetical protein